MSFEDSAIVSCGTLIPEITYLKKEGFLDAKSILFLSPGLHERPRKLAEDLPKLVREAKKRANKVIVVYGGKFCYLPDYDPFATVDAILRRLGSGITRVRASHCIDMLASEKEREEIRGGEKVWWLTPGWITYKHYVFYDWDKGKAVENFPKHTGGAILLDGVGFYEKFAAGHPEELLEYSDWMGLPLMPHKITLDRFKNLLLDAKSRLEEGIDEVLEEG